MIDGPGSKTVLGPEAYRFTTLRIPLHTQRPCELSKHLADAALPSVPRSTLSKPLAFARSSHMFALPSVPYTSISEQECPRVCVCVSAIRLGIVPTVGVSPSSPSGRTKRRFAPPASPLLLNG